MFILYAIPIGIVAGFLLGGRLDGLERLRLRWAPLVLLGLLLQVAIFSEPIGRAVGDAGPAIYVASTAIVFVAVLRNLAIPGVALIAIGAGCNLAAIVANGGWMPADPDALAAIGGIGERLHEQRRARRACPRPADRPLRAAGLAPVRERVQRRGRAHRVGIAARSRWRCGDRPGQWRAAATPAARPGRSS